MGIGADTSSLHEIMEREGIGAFVVSMHESPDPSFRWLSNGVAVTKGHVICPAGEEPLLVYYPMERDEACGHGVATRAAADFGYPQLFAAASEVAGWAGFFNRIFSDLNIAGPIAFAGYQPLHLYLPLIEELEKTGTRIHRGDGGDLLQRARRRKDEKALAAIASVGERTEAVVEHVRQMLRASVGRSGELWLGAERLTIARLKDEVSVEIVRRGMVEDHETIVSHGRDAGVPHSRGTRADVLRESVPLIIDIFPRDARSGYFFDLTRTFCVGPAPEALIAAHALVLEAHARASAAAKAGVRCSRLQADTCEFFRKNGWPTIDETPSTTRGYVHGLGHGVGLEVHERPSFASSSSNRDELEVGDVFTIEPGLYDPDAAIGVRIEDTLFIDEEGSSRFLSSGSRELTP